MVRAVGRPRRHPATGIYKHWLREHREDGLPQEIGAAFKSDRFYYQAIQN
jgi:hypothetical protein